MDLLALSLLLDGGEKIWFSIPAKHYEDFKRLMSAQPESENLECDEFLRHKNLFPNPLWLMANGIPVIKIVRLSSK